MNCDILLVNQPIDFDLYIRYSNDSYTLLIKAGNIFNSTSQQQLLENDVSYLYIIPETKEKLLEYQSKTLSQLLQNPNLTEKRRTVILHDAIINQVNYLFDEGVNKAVIYQTKEIVKVMLDQLSANLISTQSLLKLVSHNYYTYSHSVNVSIYSIALAQELGLTPESLSVVANGAILHDIGKTKIDPKIITKPARLTNEEMRIMYDHPKLGVEILRALGETDIAVLKIVGMHHYKLDGSGYGADRDEEEISIETQIVTVADIFDALSTKRTYKEAIPYFTAFKTMKVMMNNQINTQFLNKLIVLMGRSA
ncbi:HD domain-containing protein [bacterium]|nr:HD domain-containing protein [bacterium]